MSTSVRWGCRRETRGCGWCPHTEHPPPHAWLYDLVVDEAEREQSYGTELVEFVEEWAEDQGCEYVALASPLAREDTPVLREQKLRKVGVHHREGTLID